MVKLHLRRHVAVAGTGNQDLATQRFTSVEHGMADYNTSR